MQLNAPVKTIIFPDANDKDVIAYSEQDCDPILEDNKELREHNKSRDWGRMIAQVPNILLYQWLVEEWVKGNKHLRLNSREFNQTVVLPKLRDPNYKYLLV